ncbi:MAG TPA: adenylate kinase [Candidatus Binatia bacterium]|nr:adenylate kinase [Candidatus Binatia bacterium]
MNDIVMLGPQGSGKGTQSSALSEKLGLPHISLGTLFRTEVQDGTDIGREIKGYIERGDIVPAAIASSVITSRLSKGDAANGVILDGFPRTLEQADMLDNILGQLGRKLAHVIYLNVSDDEALKRLSGRRVCTNTACERNYHLEYHPPVKPGVCDRCGSPLAQRKDDTPEAIKHRLSLYHSETAPLIALYIGTGLLREIDGQRTIDAVQADILSAVGKA